MGDMAFDWIQALGWTLLALMLGYVIWKFYSTRADFTFMTHNDQGFRRALKGRGFIWHPEEFIVRGASAPRIEFVALDPASGQRRMTPLLNASTGAINLRPQYCVPLPFSAITADNHKIMVEARVQFSLSRERMFFVYHIQDFGLALETRIQSALRAEIGKRQDEDLRASLHDVEEGAVKRLRQGEADGDEAHEPGVALGVNFHTLSFNFGPADDFSPTAFSGAVAPAGTSAAASAPGEIAAAADRARALVRANGALALRPQQLDQLADVFRNRDPASTQAILTMLEMQTRQNIAEALASSGQLMVFTPQDLGLVGSLTERDAISRRNEAGAAVAPPSNGGGIHPERRA
jgi:hypothetical protein